MKFNVSSTTLFAQLQSVSRVIASKNNKLPILDNILFDLEGQTLTLSASDEETTIRTSLEVENAEGAGKVAFDAKLLLGTLREFPEQPLTFTIDEQNFGLNITSANGIYSFIGVNGSEFPAMPEIAGESNRFEIAEGTLLNAINKTLFCAADDELRQVMNGLFFDLTPEQFTLVATDAHRLVRYTNTTAHTDAPASFILPKKPALLLKNVLSKDDTMAEVVFGQKNARFTFGTTTIVCRLIDGRYPNYNGVIPQNNQNKVIIDRQMFANACKRVAVFAHTGTSLLKLTLSPDSLNISAQDISFYTSAEETLSCNYDGAPMSIGFKAPFLIELLNNIDSNEVMLELADPARAGLILPMENAENENLLMLLMPLLLQD